MTNGTKGKGLAVFTSNEEAEKAIAHNQELTAECHQLLDRVSNHRYSRKLLTLVKNMLLGCLEYKANRF